MTPTPDPNPDADPAAGLSSAPVLAHVVRSGFVESVHHGIVAATGPDGAAVLERGDTRSPILPRSANKPMQTVAMVRAGLDLDDELLALATASHSGEPYHLEGVLRLLALAGLGESDLQNTPDRPVDAAERERWITAGLAPSSLAQNCSGKHAAMLSTCVVNGWDTPGYLDPAHPLQQAIGTTVAELAGEEVAATAVDGCGAPALALSPLGLARALGRIAAADPGTPEGRVADALRARPEWLGGSGRDVTALVRAVPGLIAKDGAEAVYAVGLADGRGLAVKIADGNQRARTVVTAAALRALGVPVPDAILAELEDAPVLGHGAPVGAVVAVGL